MLPRKTNAIIRRTEGLSTNFIQFISFIPWVSNIRTSKHKTKADPAAIITFYLSFPIFLAHFDFGASDNSNSIIFPSPFSTSFTLTNVFDILGVGGTSSILSNPRPLGLLCTSLPNVALLGVNATATLRAEARSFLRTSQERFLAR